MALLCFLPPMSLEGSLPKGSGAFTHLPLKKVRAPFRGSAVQVSVAPQLGGNRREQEGSIDRKQKTKPDQGPPVHKPVLRPAGQLIVDPGAFSHRERGRKPASRLGCRHTAKLWTGSEAGRSRSSLGRSSVLTSSQRLGLLFTVCFPPCDIPGFDLQREFP